MFIGEFLCVIPLLISYHTEQQRQRKLPQGSTVNQASVFTRILARLPLGTGSTAHPNGYAAVGEEEADEEDELLDEHDDVATKLDHGDTLSGWRVCWMWFPAFFDSEWALQTLHSVNVSVVIASDDNRTCANAKPSVCGTTLMNVGLILTPVSIYQMSRGALVLWVGVLSVIFLRRRLFLYQWSSLIIVTMGVCLVGLSGSLVKKQVEEELPPSFTAVELVGRFVSVLSRRGDEDPAKVAVGVALILFAQIFTASQFVSLHFTDIHFRHRLITYGYL
jgi:hypothetical protein